MKKIESLQVKFHNRKVGSLTLTADKKCCVFEYNTLWLTEGFSISPLELPLKPGLFIAQPNPFNGNFGIFEDSLPDGYGRYLLHKALLKIGINDFELSALDRLSLVGKGGMGALTYEPETFVEREMELQDFDLLQEKALEVLREQQDTDAGLLLYNSGNSGGCRPKAIFSDEEGHWLIKFRHTYDPQDMGRQEFAYNEKARRCGIIVPDFKLIDDKYFTTRRFDITADGERIHTATAGGLLSISLSNPVLDYVNLLALTGYLTQNYKDVEQMYRRMVFNYIAENKDDHCKNFSFIVTKDKESKWHWHLAPAYDLTHCTEGYNGEHATSVNNSAHPSIEDMIAVGVKNKMQEQRCRELYYEIEDIIKQESGLKAGR